MPVRIKIFDDKSYLEFDKGSFDMWCIYHVLPNGDRYAPRDIQYFNRILKISNTCSKNSIYADFIKIYEKTTSELNKRLLKSITLLTEKYGMHALEMNIVFTILYAGMVAEENKKHAVLKKRIKRLGLHQILVEGYSATKAATYSKGKPWQELDKECKKRGF